MKRNFFANPFSASKYPLFAKMGFYLSFPNPNQNPLFILTPALQNIWATIVTITQARIYFLINHSHLIDKER